MWKSNIEVLDTGQIYKVSLFDKAKRLDYGKVVAYWQDDEGFRRFFIDMLAEDIPFSAYFWETPPVTRACFNQPFQCVLVDSPQLVNTRPDPHAFETHFNARSKEKTIVTFVNLGKDAQLIVPCPLNQKSAYSHLAVFTREAPLAQQHALWQHVGWCLEAHLGQQPLWLNTSGLGVSWLHIRLDTRPKYYTYRPYKMSSPNINRW